LRQAKTDFDCGCQRSGDEVVEKVIRLMTEEIARAYHQHMIAKLQLYWERLCTQVGRHVLPCLQRLEQAKQESAAQVGRIITAHTILEIYDEAWGAYILIHPLSTSEYLPPNVTCWMATRKYIPPNDSWSESVFRRLFDCENIASWTGVFFLDLYQKFKGLWGLVKSHINPFEDYFSRAIGRYILVTFNSDSSKDLTTDRRLGTRAKEKNRICEQAMECLIDLVGPRWSYRGKIALVLPWRFSDSIIGAERHQDYLCLPILVISSCLLSIPSRPTIILLSRHNIMALIEAITSFPQINQEILQRAK
ncbi:uncharacterized protein BKA55DRAFT_530165, partial [Fusarium redolens]